MRRNASGELHVCTCGQNGSVGVFAIREVNLVDYVFKLIKPLSAVNLRVVMSQTTVEYMRPLLIALRGRNDIAGVQLVAPAIISAALYDVSPIGSWPIESRVLAARNVTALSTLGGWRSLHGLTADLLTEWWDLPSVEFANVCPLVRLFRQLSPAIDCGILQKFMRLVIEPRWFATPADVCGTNNIKQLFGVAPAVVGAHVESESLARGDDFVRAYERAVPTYGWQSDVFLKSHPDLLDRKVRVQMLGTLLEYLVCAWMGTDLQPNYTAIMQSEFFNPKELLNADEFATFAANGSAG